MYVQCITPLTLSLLLSSLIKKFSMGSPPVREKLSVELPVSLKVVSIVKIPRSTSWYPVS